LAKVSHENSILKTAFFWPNGRTKKIFLKQLFLGQSVARK
jgi:hypothetical protein